MCICYLNLWKAHNILDSRHYRHILLRNLRNVAKVILCNILKVSINSVEPEIEDMRGLKINTNFFLKLLNSEWLVDLKHKPLEDKEVTKIVGHQELSIRER